MKGILKIGLGLAVLGLARFIATSIDTGATWTYTEFRLDGGAGAALLPQIIPSVVSTKPAAVAAWTDFRTNQINGDIYVAVSH